jgi:hypothetical protein
MEGCAAKFWSWWSTSKEIPDSEPLLELEKGHINHVIFKGCSLKISKCDHEQAVMRPDSAPPELLEMTQHSFHEILNSLPTFDNLPSRPGLPKGCTWGLWDQPQEKDELGTLNLLTESTVTEAASEIQTGTCISLKL